MCVRACVRVCVCVCVCVYRGDVLEAVLGDSVHQLEAVDRECCVSCGRVSSLLALIKLSHD